MSIKLLYIDLFCGAGGTSTGVENATIDNRKCAKVISCVNHDKNAIASHSENHPETLHFTEDIRTLDLSGLLQHLNTYRALYPLAKIVLWASLEFTNFSKAKGGLPRDADSRTLAEHLFRYIETLNPDYLQIENVKEFMAWGDCDCNGKPISFEKGKSYLKWVKNVCKYGYKYDYKILNSANFGAYTSRERYFGVFAKQGLPIVFPEPTHQKKVKLELFQKYGKWKPVKEVLDLNDEGKSIFDRDKPLVEATLERIYAGMIKFVAGGKNQFLLKYNSMNKNRKYIAPGIEDPSPVVSCQNRLGIVNATFLAKYYSGRPEGKVISIEAPAGAIKTIDSHSLVNCQFISSYYKHGSNKGINEPSDTVTTKDRLSLITSKFIVNQYKNSGNGNSVEDPSPTLLGVPKQNLVSCFLMNPQFSSPGSNVDDPCFTLIARMDKKPPYLITLENGDVAIVIYEDDSPTMKKIKEFMVMYSICDIKMRMLKIDELKAIMGFPKGYKLIGTQTEQKKYIGNAVEVNMAMAMCSSLAKVV